jgi:hypothetical protein
MFTLRPFSHYFHSEDFQKDKSLHSFYEFFFNIDQNQWITKDPYYIKLFKTFFDHLDHASIYFLYKNPRLMFIPIKGTLSCTLSSSSKYHIIVVFPELLELLKSSAYPQAFAIMAHELGHLYHRHSQKKIHTLEAQKQADYYAFQQGYGEELIKVLEEFGDRHECAERIKYIKTLYENPYT